MIEFAGRGGDALVRLFPVVELPSDPEARFAALFAQRPRWEADELEPYLAGMAVRRRCV
jgi:hypothetical protein